VVEDQKAYTKAGEVKDQAVTNKLIEGFELAPGGSLMIDVHTGVLAIGGAYTKVTKDYTLVAYVGQYKKGTQLLNVPAGKKYMVFAKGDDANETDIVANKDFKKIVVKIHFELYPDGSYYLSIPALKITEGKEKK
jgi:hypothetical protein